MVFKCKMCGGNIEFEDGNTIGTCDSCGTKQTLPRIINDKRAKLYERANSLRRANEFDKALEIYEQILNDKPDDAEAYWSVILCMYGVEYVEDPYSKERIPTVNRTQIFSIFNNENYKMALKYADENQKVIYSEEARKIDKIQKEIMAVTSKEDPYDIFICYKETDANGRRTIDSVLANNLYNTLCQEGFRVFFSRITLEDKIGTAYEPYIFGALKSSKVMIVLGTKPEYFDSPWVRNEWSRFLGFIRVSSGKKILIPAYKDMDPQNLPIEFSYLQAQNMNNIGFEQDLIRGIRKYVKKEADTNQMVQQNGFNYGYEQERGRLQAQEDFRREQQKREEEARKREEETRRKEEEIRRIELAKKEAAIKRAEEEKRIKIVKNELGRKRYYNWLKGLLGVFFVGLIICVAGKGNSFGAFIIVISIFSMIIILALKRFFFDSSFKADKEENKTVMLKFPKGFEPFHEHDFRELMEALTDVGFKNVTCRNMHDIVLGLFKKSGKIEHVYLNGVEIFAGGAKYPEDIPIVIDYHGK